MSIRSSLRSPNEVSDIVCSVWHPKKVVPVETFAGKDLMQIEVAHFEAASEQQKVLKSRFTKNSTISTGVENKKTTTEGDMSVTKETDATVKTETTEISVIIPADKESSKPAESVTVASPTTKEKDATNGV